MICPQCTSTQSKVINSRLYIKHRTRRRKCTTCGHAYTTYEILLSETESGKQNRMSEKGEVFFTELLHLVAKNT